MEGFLINIENI